MRIILVLLTVVLLFSCRTGRVKDPTYVIKQNYVDFLVFYRVGNKDYYIGKVPWPAYIIHGTDTVKLKGVRLHKTL